MHWNFDCPEILLCDLCNLDVILFVLVYMLPCVLHFHLHLYCYIVHAVMIICCHHHFVCCNCLLWFMFWCLCFCL